MFFRSPENVVEHVFTLGANTVGSIAEKVGNNLFPAAPAPPGTYNDLHASYENRDYNIKQTLLPAHNRAEPKEASKHVGGTLFPFSR